ncbi:hypothetical protein IAD21_04765 [Abditibacteriota bacterium]|nr:hypothetical protein IAD21_04765 [Abditibacteriota bacterium]
MTSYSTKSLRRALWRHFGGNLTFLFLILGVLVASDSAHAQLAKSFSNITGIKVTRLPNAVVIRIQTDGTVRFGGDFRDWLDVDNGFDLRPTQSVRLRLVQARSQLPAYVPIDAYPLDGAAISLGRSEFSDPFFSDGAYDQPQPLVDVELRFAAPVTIRKFTVQPGRSTWFGDYLGPREASIELSNDRRAIVVTIIPDRADLMASQHLDRSPLANRKHNLSVAALGTGVFRVEALHAPLRELLGRVAESTGTRFVAREDVADVPISLFLPRTTPLEFLQTLQRVANVGSRDENGTLILGRGDEFFATRSLPLFNLSPDAARLLFPDFLLPFLRPDRQNNALLCVQTPLMLDKIEAQLRQIDAPRAQFEVSAQFWELAGTKDNDYGLQLLRSIGGDRQSLNMETGEAFVRIEKAQTAQLSAALRLLSTQGHARLSGNPRVSVLSGAHGTLFLGQTRYVQVFQNSGKGQSAKAIPLRIGAQLEVSPRGSNTLNDPIRIDIAPRLSTVDDIETGTGLPTLGIRELSGTMIVKEGDSVVLAGLESDLDFRTRRRALGIFPSGRSNREVRSLLVLVSARRLTWSEPRTVTNGRVKQRWVAINPLYASPQ